MGFQIGDTVGDYEIVNAIGEGGAGRVFRVKHRITGRVEAMKTLLHGRVDSEAPAERFQREIQLQASLDHPNIASVHNAFWSGEQLVMVMELVPGVSLDRLIEAGPLPPGRTLRYAVQCLIALEYAHGRGITHRDIKPENIMVTPDGVIKLMDFGLAKDMRHPKLTQPGAVVGSLYYISPEQARGRDETDHRTDIYSFGAVLYEMATGDKPFPHANSFALLQAAVEETPPRPSELQPSLPKAMDEAILRALEKNPDERFQSAKEFRRTLEALARNPASGVAASTIKISPKSPSRLEREGARPLLVRATLVALSLAGLAFLGVRGLTENPLVREVKSYQEAAAPPAPAAVRSAAARYQVSLSTTLPAPANFLRFSSDGRLALVGDSEGRVALFDVHAGERAETVDRVGTALLDGTFSPDGERAAAGGADGAARLWTVAKPQEMRELTHVGAVTAVAFSADGEWLASGSADRSVRLWSLVNPGESLGFAGPASGPAALAFSPAGPLLAAAADEPVVRLWGFGEERSREKLPGLAAGGAAALAFSPNGLELAAAGGGRIALWDLPTRERKLAFDLPADRVALACSPGGRWLALAAPREAPRRAELWGVKSGEKLAAVEHDAAITALALDATGRRLGAATADGRITLWEAAPEAQTHASSTAPALGPKSPR